MTPVAELVTPPVAPGRAAIDAVPGFDAAGRVTLRRVLWRRWLGLTGRWFWFCLPVLAGLLVWAVGGGGMRAFWLGVVCCAALAGLSFALVWRQRPSVYAALALWDREAGRREAFAAAWWFEGLPGRTAAETAHWQAEVARLPEALRRLRVDLPLPRWRKLLWLPVALFGIALAGWQAETRARGPELTPEMVDAARARAREIERLQKDAEKLSALSEAEQEALRRQLREAVAELENSDGKTARELMDALEKKARETEKLAERLGADADEWASPELTAALRRQADTADLGDAVADRKATAAAGAADTLAEKLDATADAQEERLREVFENAEREALAEDRERPVGAAVAEGAAALRADQSQEAAAAMRELARQMRDLAGRRQTQEELERLAQQLRDAGSQVANAQAGENLPALAMQTGQSGEGAQAGSAATAQPQEPPPEGAAPPESGEGALALASPESGQDAGRSGGAEGQMKPQDGPQLSLGSRDPNAGQGGEKPDGDAPLLLAPVPPGGAPDDKPPEMAVIMPGNAPGGGAFAGAGSALPPGAGAAEMKGEGTEALDHAKQSLVNASSTGEGASMLRQVEGGAPRDEAAERTGAALTVEFLEAQEAALDESALPAARREQVRRYFNALRKRLEGEK